MTTRNQNLHLNISMIVAVEFNDYDKCLDVVMAGETKYHFEGEEAEFIMKQYSRFVDFSNFHQTLIEG